MAKSSGPRTYAKSIRLNLGMAGTTGNLKPLRRTERADSMTTLCPQCPTKAEQRYICTHGHSDPDANGRVMAFLPGDCRKGKAVGDTFEPLSKEEIEALRKDSEGGTTLELRVHPADQVEGATIPTGTAYRFEPEGDADSFYGVLADLVVEPDLAFIGLLTLRGKSKMFRLQRAPHGLVLLELARPEDVYAFEPVVIDYKAKYLTMALALVDAEKADFDPDLYHDDTAEKVAELLASKGVSVDVNLPVPAQAKASAGKADDLEAMFAASIAAAEAKKALA